jgi:DNA-binding transcriptional LysR family regulator
VKEPCVSRRRRRCRPTSSTRSIARYLKKYPDVRVVLHTAERRLDIVREGFDVAVWGGPLDDSSLVARKLGVAAGGYFASSSFRCSGNGHGLRSTFTPSFRRAARWSPRRGPF